MCPSSADTYTVSPSGLSTWSLLIGGTPPRWTSSSSPPASAAIRKSLPSPFTTSHLPSLLQLGASNSSVDDVWTSRLSPVSASMTKSSARWPGLSVRGMRPAPDGCPGRTVGLLPEPRTPAGSCSRDTCPPDRRGHAARLGHVDRHPAVTVPAEVVATRTFPPAGTRAVPAGGNVRVATTSAGTVTAGRRSTCPSRAAWPRRSGGQVSRLQDPAGVLGSGSNPTVLPGQPSGAGLMPRTLRPGQRAELFVIDAETGESRLVHTSSTLLFEAPNWSSDGKWLVVNGDGKLFRIAAEAGGDLEEVDLGGAPPINNDHVLSPDGQTVY